jgi:hypothetical protein
VGAAVVGIVEDVNIAGFELVTSGLNHALDAFAHGAEVDGNVGCIGHQLPMVVEDRAGEVEPFFDVDGVAGILQRYAHFVGDGAEEVVEDFQQNGIGGGGGSVGGWMGGWGDG